MDVLTGHLVVVLVFFVTALIATFTPVLLSRRNEKLSSHDRCHSIIDFSNSVGGGVLLATCFIALIPMVEHSYKNALVAMNSSHTDRPFAEITILCGFFLVVFIEQLVIVVQRRRATAKNAALMQMATRDEQETLFSDDDSSNAAQPSPEHNGISHSHNHTFDAKSLLHSVILVVTLGLHTLFEGMAIGLIDNADTLAALAVAVLLHELCCAVALGINLAKQNISVKAALVVCLFFSLMMPVGIGVGMAVGQISGVAGLLLTAILQGIATGTFLFVLFIEIVPSVMSSANPGIKMMLMLGGCVFMTLLIVFMESHNHGQVSAGAPCPDLSTASPLSNHTPKLFYNITTK